MSDLVLYGCPKACSLVSHIALEMSGAPYTYKFVDLFNGEQRTEAFLARNPRGKVPLLEDNGEQVCETVAILHWLAQRFPAAGLLPAPGSADHIQALSDLVWFASGVHPAMTRMLMPARFLAGKDCRTELRDAAVTALSAEFTLIDERLRDRSWWLDSRSALDAYLFWIWARSGEGPIDLTAFPHFARHTARMLSTAEVGRVLSTERRHLPCFERLEATANPGVPEA